MLLQGEGRVAQLVLLLLLVLLRLGLPLRYKVSRYGW